MRATLPDPGRLAEEPKDGDFVAYLARIEQRQLAALPVIFPGNAPGQVPKAESPSDRAPALTAAQAEALRARLHRGGGQARQLVGAAFFGLFGLFFALAYLLDAGGVVTLLIAVFLLWRAAVLFGRARRAAADPAGASRMVDALRSASKAANRNP